MCGLQGKFLPLQLQMEAVKVRQMNVQIDFVVRILLQAAGLGSDEVVQLLAGVYGSLGNIYKLVRKIQNPIG